jgi:hypothetical protein
MNALGGVALVARSVDALWEFADGNRQDGPPHITINSSVCVTTSSDYEGILSSDGMPRSVANFAAATVGRPYSE